MKSFKLVSVLCLSSSVALGACGGEPRPLGSPEQGVKTAASNWVKGIQENDPDLLCESLYHSGDDQSCQADAKNIIQNFGANYRSEGEALLQAIQDGEVKPRGNTQSMLIYNHPGVGKTYYQAILKDGRWQVYMPGIEASGGVPFSEK